MKLNSLGRSNPCLDFVVFYLKRNFFTTFMVGHTVEVTCYFPNGIGVLIGYLVSLPLFLIPFFLIRKRKEPSALLHLALNIFRCVYNSLIKDMRGGSYEPPRMLHYFFTNYGTRFVSRVLHAPVISFSEQIVTVTCNLFPRML